MTNTIDQNESLGSDGLTTVCVLGLGYIGLPTAAFIASGGVSVIGVDINTNIVASVNNGEAPFHEDGFDALLSEVVSANKLTASTSPVEADCYIIAVPTPFLADRSVDTTYIESAVESIAPVVRPGALVILESTSPPGTTEFVAEKLLELRPDLSDDPTSDNPIFIAHCPERVIPGAIMREMVSNDRVIGGINDRSAELAATLYSRFCRGEILLTDAKTAEMAKLAENSYRDVNIAFANELSMIADKLGIDVWRLIEIANHHPRVNILQPGPGVGGHCIAVDPWFIVSAVPEVSKLIRTAREVNDAKPTWVIEQVSKIMEPGSDSRIALLGIAFKADIDDLRESPAVEIVRHLATGHPDVQFDIVEPNINELPATFEDLNNVSLAALDSAIEQAQIIVLLVDHKEFKEIDENALAFKKVLDTKGILGRS